MSKLDILGVGNPLLDIGVGVDDSFLEKEGLAKGTMILISRERVERLLNDIQKIELITNAGGSVANTLAMSSLLGSSTCFIGKIGSGEYGEKYLSLTKDSNIISGLSKANNIQGTCLVLTTPDTERTMATFLGASQSLCTKDIDFSLIDNAKILHVEAYLLDSSNQTDVLFEVARYANKKGVLVSIDLADPALITRHKKILSDFVKECADIVFANEDEAKLFTGFEKELAAKELGKFCKIAIVKFGKDGSVIFSENDLIKINSFVVKAVNTTGAGDAYAGGFLHAYTKGLSFEKCGKIASFVAAEVVKLESARLLKGAVIDIEKILSL